MRLLASMLAVAIVGGGLAATSRAAAARAAPDLALRALSHPPAPTAAGRLTVRHAVRNVGRRRARRSVVGYYLSPDRTLDRRRDARLGPRRRVRALRSGKVARRRVTLALPAGLRAGRYWLFACADDRRRLRERREHNNCRRSRVTIAASLPGTRSPSRPAPLPMTPASPVLPPMPVGPAGGRVVADGGRVILDFPPGALDRPIDLTVTPVAVPPGAGVLRGTAYELGPDGADFLEPVTVTIAYDPAAVGGSEADLQLVELHAGDALEPKPTAPVDTAGDRVTGQLRGFSTIAVDSGIPWPGPELTATWNADRTITLSWVAVATGPPVAGVELQRARLTGTLRRPRESEWAPRVLLPGRPFTDPAGPGAGFSWYRARWVGRQGGRSLWSAPVRVTVLGAPAPPADPPTLTAQPVECGGVRLTWSPVLEAGGYTIERAEAGAPFTPLAELGGTDLSYLDTDVEPGGAYRYRVLAQNSAGASPGRTMAQATSSSSQFTLGLSPSAVAVPPGRSVTVPVDVTRHSGAFDVELAFETRPELAGAVAVAFQPQVTPGDSVATISVDPRAGTGLVVRGTVVARASAPGAGTCSVPLTVHVGRPSCEITMPDVRLRPTAGTQLVDLFVDRTGFAGPVGLTVRFDDTAFETYATLSFVPNPAAGRSTALIDVLRDLPGSGHATTALVRAVPPEGVARPCGRQVRLIFPAS